MEKMTLFGQNPAWKNTQQNMGKLFIALLRWGEGLPARPLAMLALVIYGTLAYKAISKMIAIFGWNPFSTSLIWLTGMTVVCVYIVVISIRYLKGGHL